MATQAAVANRTTEQRRGQWVSERTFEEITGISRQTLTNWRYKDRKQGRTTAPPGFPEYRLFGRTVRYWVGEELAERTVIEEIAERRKQAQAAAKAGKEQLSKEQS